MEVGRMFYGDYRSCLLGALKMMGRNHRRQVVVGVTYDGESYCCGWGSDWDRFPFRETAPGWRLLFRMDAGDMIALLCCRFDDLFEGVLDAVDKESV